MSKRFCMVCGLDMGPFQNFYTAPRACSNSECSATDSRARQAYVNAVSLTRQYGASNPEARQAQALAMRIAAESYHFDHADGRRIVRIEGEIGTEREDVARDDAGKVRAASL